MKIPMKKKIVSMNFHRFLLFHFHFSEKQNGQENALFTIKEKEFKETFKLLEPIFRSLLRSRFSGCHATLPPHPPTKKTLGGTCVTSTKRPRRRLHFPLTVLFTFASVSHESLMNYLASQQHSKFILSFT